MTTSFGTGLHPGSVKVKPIANWKPYAGFSYLFDNEGNSFSTSKENALAQIDCNVFDNSELIFYKCLFECMQKIGGDELINNHLLFPLPYSTYHVTAWDGINIEIFDDLSEEGKKCFKAFLENPKDIDGLLPLIPENEFSKLFNKITFVFKGLSLGGNTVVKAALEPKTLQDREVLELINKERLRLDKEYDNLFKKPRNLAFHPHVALGYFSNPIIADSIWKTKSFEWNKVFDEIEGKSISFSSISLYGFSDMLTYFKKATS